MTLASVVESGHSWPIFYSGLISGKMVGKADRLLTVKWMTSRVVNKFSFGFLNGNMQPFFPEIDLKKNPITFTLVFFKK